LQPKGGKFNKCISTSSTLFVNVGDGFDQLMNFPLASNFAREFIPPNLSSGIMPRDSTIASPGLKLPNKEGGEKQASADRRSAETEEKLCRCTRLH
jgi:hypothetical protein